jgi:hypothetical protein
VHQTLALDSRLPDTVWDELEYIHLTNDNGGMLHAHIQAVSRVPWMHGDVGCEEPLFDTYVRIQTAVGVIWLDGNIMTYDDGMDKVFEDAGFETQPNERPQPGGLRRQLGRRLVGMVELIGWFNSIPAFEAWNSTYDAPPTIPVHFRAEALMVHACVQNATDQCSELSFGDEHTITILGEKYAKSNVTTWSDGQGSTRERYTGMPFLKNWAYDFAQSNGKVYRSQVWQPTGERYHCRDNATQSPSSAFTMAPEKYLAAYKGIRTLEGEEVHYFVIKSRAMVGAVGEFYLKEAAGGEEFTIMHPRFMQAHFGCYAGHSPKSRQGHSFGFLYKSFTALDDDSADDHTINGGDAAATLPFECPTSDPDEVLTLKKEVYSDKIQGTNPFVAFNLGPAWSALNTILSLKPTLTAAQYDAQYRAMEHQTGGVRLLAHFTNLRMDDTKTMRRFEKEKQDAREEAIAQAHAHGHSAAFIDQMPEDLGANLTMLSDMLVEHTNLSTVLSRQEWALATARDHGLPFLKELIVWRLRDFGATEANVGSVEAGNITWADDEQTSLRVLVLPLRQSAINKFYTAHLDGYTNQTAGDRRRRHRRLDEESATAVSVVEEPVSAREATLAKAINDRQTKLQRRRSLSQALAHTRRQLAEEWGGGCNHDYVDAGGVVQMVTMPGTGWMEPVCEMTMGWPTTCEWSIECGASVEFGIVYGEVSVGVEWGFGFGDDGTTWPPMWGAQGCLTLTGGVGFSQGGLSLGSISIYGCIGVEQMYCPEIACVAYASDADNEYYQSMADYWYNRYLNLPSWYPNWIANIFLNIRNAWINKIDQCVEEDEVDELVTYMYGAFGLTGTVGNCGGWFPACLEGTGEARWNKFPDEKCEDEATFTVTVTIEGCFGFCGTVYGPNEVYSE